MEDKATSNPVIVMIDEDTSNRYMRQVSQKGLGEERDMPWLVHDMHDDLKAWGRPGGPGGKLILKSDAEKPMIALREAIARLHGGVVTPEQPPKGEHASNGRVEEAGRTIRDMVRVLKLQLESNLGWFLRTSNLFSCAT